MQALTVLDAALYAKVPAADLQRLLLGESQSGVNLGPYFKWTGSLRAAFATAETFSEAAGKWGNVSRRLMTACLRNKNIAALKVCTKAPKLGLRHSQGHSGIFRYRHNNDI